MDACGPSRGCWVGVLQSPACRSISDMQQMAKAAVCPGEAAASRPHFRPELALEPTVTCCFSFEELLLWKGRQLNWCAWSLVQLDSQQDVDEWLVHGPHREGHFSGLLGPFLVVFFSCVTSSSGVWTWFFESSEDSVNCIALFFLIVAPLKSVFCNEYGSVKMCTW